MTSGDGENMYECWNPRCAKYAGSHVKLRGRDVFEFDGEARCMTCGRTVTSIIDLPDWMVVVPVVIAFALVALVAITR